MTVAVAKRGAPRSALVAHDMKKNAMADLAVLIIGSVAPAVAGGIPASAESAAAVEMAE